MKVLVIGAGHQGIAMAGHLALCGHQVNLWNRSENHIKQIKKNNQITINGIVSGTAILHKVSSCISDLICNVIMVTTPSTAHKDIAKTIAPYVREDTVIVLNPGRTFGAIDFANSLLKNGVEKLPHIAETQTIVYTCRKYSPNGATVFAIKKDVGIAALSGSDISYILSSMPECLSVYYKPLPTTAITSLSNVGMILHCAPVLMNIGWIESLKVDFKYYYDGISESIAKYIEKMDGERMCVAEALGYRIESTKEWMKRTYDLEGDTLFQCIRNNDAYKEIDAPPSINCRYIFEDVPNGLVPIEKIGVDLSVPTPNITTTIDLANAIFSTDFRKNGRAFPVHQIRKFI